MNRFRCLVPVLVAAAVLFPASSAGARARGWALVVGVDRYDSTRISPLRCACADAREVARVLRESCGLLPEHVLLMTTDGPAAERPTSTNILSRLAGLRGVVRPDDAFIFYFSGHGVIEHQETFLLTSDAALVSTALLRRSALDTKDLIEAIGELRASRVLLLMDACRNDPRAGRGTGDNPLTGRMARDLALTTVATARAPDVLATLFACRVGQRSYEGYHGHGYFTYYLAKGLEGAAMGPDGTVTIPSLLGYLERTVAETVRVNEPGCRQQPWADISGSGAASWVLARAAAGPAVAPAAPPGTTRIVARLPGAVTAALVRQTCAVLQRRLPRARLHLEPAGRIVIDLPQSADLSTAVRRIQTRGLLDFRERQGGSGDWVDAMDGRSVAYAEARVDAFHYPTVLLHLTAKGRARLAALTRRLVGKPLGVFFDGKLVTAPVVREVIAGGEATITAQGMTEARTLAELITSGELPRPVEVVSVQKGEAKDGR